MAERVAWRCSFPGCQKNTVGPNSSDPTKKINNGIAAHICAAAPNGPRYDLNMSPEERKSITNGIWMCRDHGSLIDSDYSEYSVDTLKQWKQNAEDNAATSLREPTKVSDLSGSSFLQLGNQLICNVHWYQVSANKWKFELVNIEIGNKHDFHDYILNFNNLDEHERYVVVESQGDARLLNEIKLSVENQTQYIELSVKDKMPSTDPNKLGFTLKLGEDGDLCIDSGIMRISGIEAAVQSLSTTMSFIRGELKDAEWLGSNVTDYYHRYSGDLQLFSRLIKMEFIRLSLIPMKEYLGSEKRTSLPFVKRFNKITVLSRDLKFSSIIVNVDLEWGDCTNWNGEVRVFILET
ncbi:hypothetical protein VFSR5_2693 [Aliivibrio fischeri SR5]|uniref:Lysogenic conversion protein n=2 Tax=Aliivibrio fischeri TaxID=668 RepID=A0AAV3EM73_ALIFS|nr:hypothetical protein VFSR5_2693 [Aliivibrio fischeri SR5]